MGGIRFVTMRYKGWGNGEFGCYVIIEWPFTDVKCKYKFDLPQVKCKWISSLINFAYELPHELPNDYLRISEKKKKISKLGENKC